MQTVYGTRRGQSSLKVLGAGKSGIHRRRLEGVAFKYQLRCLALLPMCLLIFPQVDNK
jgi:hypothetical protein